MRRKDLAVCGQLWPTVASSSRRWPEEEASHGKESRWLGPLCSSLLESQDRKKELDIDNYLSKRGYKVFSKPTGKNAVQWVPYFWPDESLRKDLTQQGTVDLPYAHGQMLFWDAKSVMLYCPTERRQPCTHILVVFYIPVLTAGSAEWGIVSSPAPAPGCWQMESAHKYLLLSLEKLKQS